MSSVHESDNDTVGTFSLEEISHDLINRVKKSFGTNVVKDFLQGCLEHVDLFNEFTTIDLIEAAKKTNRKKRDTEKKKAEEKMNKMNMKQKKGGPKEDDVDDGPALDLSLIHI